MAITLKQVASKDGAQVAAVLHNGKRIGSIKKVGSKFDPINARGRQVRFDDKPVRRSTWRKALNVVLREAELDRVPNA